MRNAVGFLVATCVAQRDLARAEGILAAMLARDTPMEMQGQRSAAELQT